VPTGVDGAVEAFLEKTSGEVPTNRINAGAYIVEREVVESIPPGRAVSFEREIFPELVGNGLQGYASEGYWIDIGTPDRYLEATWDLLAGRVASQLPPRDETGSLILEGCLVAGAHVGPQSVLGRHCSVGSDSRIDRSVLHDRVLVAADAHVEESVLAEGVRVGKSARIGPGAMIGARATIGEEAVIGEKAKLDPGVEVGAGARVGAGEQVAAPEEVG
jgi:mannose-1-phosphate guanylyltransferase